MTLQAVTKTVACTACGATEAPVEARPGDELAAYGRCPRCEAQYAMGDLAVDNLAQIVADLIPTWKSYWVRRGADPQYLLEILEPAERVLLNSYMRPVITEAYRQS